MAALGGQGADSIEGLRQLNRQTARHLASRHLERLRTLNPTALRIVDKMPENYLYLGLLASLFPRAKLIHCRRDLRDVAVSCWMTHFQEIRWANDQQHIASRFHEYQRMMEHWRKVLPVPLLEVDYEETVADLEGVARKLVAWCGLAWEPGCLEFHQAKRPVRTASAVQVASRSSGHRWEDGSTTSRRWLRCSPDWKGGLPSAERLSLPAERRDEVPVPMAKLRTSRVGTKDEEADFEEGFSGGFCDRVAGHGESRYGGS